MKSGCKAYDGNQELTCMNQKVRSRYAFLVDGLQLELPSSRTLKLIRHSFDGTAGICPEQKCPGYLVMCMPYLFNLC